ncbi:uncharacterized protein EV154DRAFT_548766 [Mucor mucedo]|uniref:uncharacterized protein n=1 Tax=Mucor mucedo TaxID=29922 RepID=UPI00221FBEC3|nr:uncharacterized protein EV154DRAFT_548766 [Mucor mucedo]KAI7894888.1 hypothetical protein EV154DRAFT_548766 [Mucor mucedo]
MLTCYISDPSLESGTCCLNIFSKSFETLEAFQENRIVKMTNFFVKEFNNNPQITLNSFSKYALFTATEIKQIELGNMNLPAAPNDKAIMKALDNWNAEASGSEAMVWVPTKRPLLETSQLYDDPSKYFDFVGQIVDIKNFDAFTLLVLTDFTENPYPPTLPVDQKVLDPNICDKLDIKDFVFLRNCVKKLTDTLEFNIHGSNDQSKPQVVHISPDDDLLKNVLARRKSVKASLKKRTRDQLEAYPLRTEFITKKRGGLKILKYIKSRRVMKIMGFVSFFNCPSYELNMPYRVNTRIVVHNIHPAWIHSGKENSHLLTVWTKAVMGSCSKTHVDIIEFSNDLNVTCKNTEVMTNHVELYIDCILNFASFAEHIRQLELYESLNNRFNVDWTP